jgi:thiaminase
MERIEPSAAEIGYASFLDGQTIIDDWLSLYIITIPCIYGWSEIARTLDRDPGTDRTTVFYRTFIQPNLNDESGRKLCQFIEANRPHWASDVTVTAWNTLFRAALKFEIGLFDSVLV